MPMQWRSQGLHKWSWSVRFWCHYQLSCKHSRLTLSHPLRTCLSREGREPQLCLGSKTSRICWSPVKCLQADLEGTWRWRAGKTGSSVQQVGNWKENFCTWPKWVLLTPRKIWPLGPQGISRDFFPSSEKLNRSSSDTEHGTIFQCSFSSSSLWGQRSGLGNASVARGHGQLVSSPARTGFGRGCSSLWAKVRSYPWWGAPGPEGYRFKPSGWAEAG